MPNEYINEIQLRGVINLQCPHDVMRSLVFDIQRYYSIIQKTIRSNICVYSSTLTVNYYQAGMIREISPSVCVASRPVRRENSRNVIERRET